MKKDRTAQTHSMPIDGRAGFLSKLGPLMEQIIGPAATAINPILGSLISAGINFGGNALSTVFQNKYNSPESQIKRLGKAGLPPQAIFSNIENRQSSAPQFNIAPDLGAAENIERQQVDRMQKQQFLTMQLERMLTQEKIRKEGAVADNVGLLRDFNFMNPADEMQNNFWYNMKNRQQILEATNIIRANERDISNIDKRIYEELDNDGYIKQGSLGKIMAIIKNNERMDKLIDNLVKQGKFMDMNNQRFQTKNDFYQQLAKDLENSPFPSAARLLFMFLTSELSVSPVRY